MDTQAQTTHEPVTLNSGYYVEAMDRLYCIQNQIETNVCEHMVYTHDETYSKLIDEIQRLLGCAYQVVGEKHFNLLDVEQKKFEEATIQKYLDNLPKEQG